MTVMENKMRNDQVAKSWANGESNVRTSNGNLSVRNGKLYSYNLMIAEHNNDGNTIIWDYTASGEYYSQTTSKHVGLARRYASDYTLMPPGE